MKWEADYPNNYQNGIQKIEWSDTSYKNPNNLHARLSNIISHIEIYANNTEKTNLNEIKSENSKLNNVKNEFLINFLKKKREETLSSLITDIYLNNDFAKKIFKYKHDKIAKVLSKK